jgi:hypothetical protein
VIELAEAELWRTMPRLSDGQIEKLRRLLFPASGGEAEPKRNESKAN